MATATRRRQLRFLDALPPYFGGKRKLLDPVAKALPPPTEARVLVDAFLGGGSVSLWGKRRGYRVIANDIAERSVIVGRALIENDRVTAIPSLIQQLTVRSYTQKSLTAAVALGRIGPPAVPALIRALECSRRSLIKRLSLLLEADNTLKNEVST